VKKSSIAQNHFWDVRIYNLGLKEIVMEIFMRDMKIKNATWADFVNKFLGR
jgi:hypothetical protein